MRQSMLTDEQAKFLREEKEALAEIRLALSEIDVPRESLATLQEAILQLDELFLVVIVSSSDVGSLVCPRHISVFLMPQPIHCELSPVE